MADELRPAAPDWAELVHRGVESDELDYKSPMNWNTLSRAARAKLLRHCLAFANTRGGYLVIGVREDAAGHPSECLGLTNEECQSFDPTPVLSFMNRFVEPPLNITIERPEVDGKRYAIFVIRPFTLLPHVCSNGVDGELQQGVFYIRTTDASSRPAIRADELHRLIQRALRNQRELLAKMLRGLLYETREPESADTPFTDAMDTVRHFFLRRHPLPAGETGRVRLEFSMMPPDFEERRYEFSDLRSAMQAGCYTPPGGGIFLDSEDMAAGYCTNTAFRVAGEDPPVLTQLFRSGLFWQTRLVDTPDRLLSARYLLLYCAEAVAAAGRIAAALNMEAESLELTLRIDRAENLKLDGGFSEYCRIDQIETRFKRSAANLAANPVEHAAYLFRQTCERFNLPDRIYRQLPDLIAEHLQKK